MWPVQRHVLVNPAPLHPMHGAVHGDADLTLPLTYDRGVGFIVDVLSDVVTCMCVPLQVYEPADKLYLFGLNPLLDPSKRTYIATGDSGQGMTGAPIAAMVLTDAILDRPNPWRDVRVAQTYYARTLAP